MLICPTKDEMRQAMAGLRAQGRTVALVPTMGFLHEGHMALIDRATELCDAVAVSIFVNPTQFGANEDLASYPRDAVRDLALLREAGVAAVFVPTPEEMYHPDAETVVETTRLSTILMGALRPGHFRGVATVVAKLLNIVQPDVSVFGEKDFQQLAVIRTIVRDLDIPVRIEGVPTAREADGLALSSRNVRLAPADRAAAPVLARALDAAEAALADGADVAALERRVRDAIAAEPRADLQSADIRDAATLQPVDGRLERPAVVLLAAQFGNVLLIDQRVVTPIGSPP